MSDPMIRPARADEYDEVARVWMESWVSTGLEDASNFLLANLRARVLREVAHSWSLFVADDDGRIAAMLALLVPDHYLDQLFVAPEYQGRSVGRKLLAFTRSAFAGRNLVALRPRKRKGLALVRTRGLCVREASGRTDDRFCDEILPMEERGDIPDDAALLVATLTLVLRAMADGGNRAAL